MPPHDPSTPTATGTRPRAPPAASDTPAASAGRGSGTLSTPDGRYIIVRGRLWRRSDPALTEPERVERVSELMTARRDVARALRAGEPEALRTARARVNRAKVALGERGPVWWGDGAPDYTRRLASRTPYADWYAGLQDPTASGEDTGNPSGR